MKRSTATLAAAAATGLAVALLKSFEPVEPYVVPGMTVLITGGSRGLGLALAHRFGRAGCKLALLARSADELELARDGLLRSRDVRHEDDILLISADLTDPGQCASAIDQVLQAFGKLDILINNAGIIQVGPFEDQPLHAYDEAMALTFFASLHLTHAAVRHMLPRQSGAIVNISSLGGKIAVPHLLPYVAAKFALTGLSEGLHAELRGKGIQVTTVCPGLMRTGGEDHARFTGRVDEERQWFDFGAKTPGLAATPEHAAERIFQAVEHGRAEITITPQATLAARIWGLAPEFSQYFASLVNQYGLPEPLHAIPQPAPLHEHDEPEEEPANTTPTPRLRMYTQKSEGSGLPSNRPMQDDNSPVIDPSPS